MPIEIKELLIKTTLTTDSKKSDDGGESQNLIRTEDFNEKMRDLRLTILSECIENVSRLIKTNSER